MSNDLTELEIQILRLIALGRPRKEIAAWLHYSPKTISCYTTAIYKKLGIHTSGQATAYAIRAGLVAGDEANIG